MSSSKVKHIEASAGHAKKAVREAAEDTTSAVSTEFRNFVADIEDLIKSSASLTGDELDKAKEKIGERITQAKESLGEVKESIVEQARKTAEVADHYVHEQPWTAVGAGAALGLLIGFLLARRD